MKTNLILATTLLACTPFAFAKAPSPDFRMDAPAMPDILLDAPAMPDVVMVVASTPESQPEALQGPSQDGPQVTPPPPPPMQGHGPQGVRMHGNEGPGGPGMGHDTDRGMGPHGMWWKNPEVVAAIGLTTDQQKKIEDLFTQSRVQLIDLHSTLEKEQVMLEPVLNANPLDQSKALAAIDKIANTRADLEKANGKMLLSIRGVLTPEQWTKLQAQHEHPRGAGGPGGKRGPGAPGVRKSNGPPPPPAPSDLE